MRCVFGHTFASCAAAATALPCVDPPPPPSSAVTPQSALDTAGHAVRVREGLLADMEALITETFHALRNRVGRPAASTARHEFELLGFDFLVDAANKVWMLEVNLNPSIMCVA